MKSSADLTKLIQQIELEADVVTQPDHPLLLHGPDMLISRIGSLVAVFTPKSEEMRNPNKLFTRLALTRLALPKNTRCIALLEDEDNLKIGKAVEDNTFHAFFNIKRPKSLIRFIKDAQAKDTYVEPIPPEITKQSTERYAVLFSESIALLSKVKKSSRPTKKLIEQLPSVKTYQWFYNKVDTFSKLRQLEDSSTWIGVEETSNRRNWSNQLKDYLHKSTQLSFSLDRGVPYFKGNNQSMGFLLTDDIRSSLYDPLKSLRAAAFAGLIVTNINDLSTAREIRHRIRQEIQDASKFFDNTTTNQSIDEWED